MQGNGFDAKQGPELMPGLGDFTEVLRENCGLAFTDGAGPPSSTPGPMCRVGVGACAFVLDPPSPVLTYDEGGPSFQHFDITNCAVV